MHGLIKEMKYYLTKYENELWNAHFNTKDDWGRWEKWEIKDYYVFKQTVISFLVHDVACTEIEDIFEEYVDE